ncbi:MAG: carboxylesterase/lipase family protein [Proteobacteria bacterium]|nr:carboxylesterase/lipase family protein [Pseudomonadota bacterium]
MGIVAETAEGKIEGTSENNIAVFRGIPYAEPPVGELRFKPPQPKKPWPGTIATKAYGHHACQGPDPVQERIWATTGAGNEDCLTLNIWTPGLDRKRRPVLVWIHGGAFVVGASSRPATNGSSLAGNGDVVVVSLNYRLGALGWLNLDRFGSEFDHSGNHGLLDQIAALKWIQANIERFGGDPENVTLFGLSAGGNSISVLMTSSKARGLFHKAIAQSGGANNVRSLERSRKVAEAFFTAAGFDNLKDLLAMDAKEIIRIQTEGLNGISWDLAFGPVLDGSVLPESTMGKIKEGASAGIPLLIGTTLDEYRYWYMEDPHLPTLETIHLKGWIAGNSEEDPDEIIDAYRKSRPHLTENQLAVTIVGDGVFRMPSTRMAEERSRMGEDTWMYLFTWPSPVENGLLGAAHGMETAFVFGTLNAPNVHLLTGDGAERQGLSRVMQDAWIAFAKNGNPNHSGLPDWSPYDKKERTTLIFDMPCRIESDPYGNERRSWGDAPFDVIA